MHHPSDQPRQSLYYPYKVHPVGAIPQAPTPCVVIAGAGPSGMVTALELARHGVGCVLLESERQVSEGSRAIVFTRRSMEILHQAGAAEAMMSQGLPWRFGNSFYRGQRVFRMEAPHDPHDRFFPMLNLQQQFMEEALIEAIGRQPLIELRWGHRVDRVDPQQGEGLMLEVDTPHGRYQQPASWLVASDGARSSIRSAQGLKMEGSSYEGRFVIADIRIDLPLPTERLAFFDPDWNRGNTVLMHREPLGIWRIDYQLPPGESPEEALARASLRERINAQLAMIGHGGKPWELDWCSVYTARTMTLPEYVHGRVIYTGDAAHMLPIFGVRGANTAFQDAQNLGWKLALTAQGLAGPGLLPSYSSERVGVAREIIEESGKSTRFMTPPTRGFRLLRDATLSLALKSAFVRPLFHWRTSRSHAYSTSPLNDPGDDNALFEAGPALGDTMLNVRLSPERFLMDHQPPGFMLMYFGDGEGLPAGLARRVDDWYARGIHLSVLQIDGLEPVHLSEAPWRLIVDGSGELRQRYGVRRSGAAYLIRPDQHVCARWLQLCAERFDKAMTTALGACRA